MSFGALSTLLGQLPVITTTITNCVLMSKMMKQFSGSNTAGGYDLFGTSSTTNPYTGLDWFQPKYSNTEDKDETPSAPVDYDEKHSQYADINAQDGTSVNDDITNLNTKMRENNGSIKLSSDGKTWTSDTMEKVKDFAGNTIIEISEDGSSSANYATNVTNLAASMVKNYDKDNDGKISKEEYLEYKTENLSAEEKSSAKASIEKMFEMLDIDNSGKIGHKELASYLSYLDQGVYTSDNKPSTGEHEDLKGQRNGSITGTEYVLNSTYFRSLGKVAAQKALKEQYDKLYSAEAQVKDLPY